jgi:hypothetical protein
MKEIDALIEQTKYYKHWEEEINGK